MDTERNQTQTEGGEATVADTPSSPDVENGQPVDTDATAAEPGAKATAPQNGADPIPEAKAHKEKAQPDKASKKAEKAKKDEKTEKAKKDEDEDDEITLEEVDLIDPVERALLNAPAETAEKRNKKRKKIKESKIKSALGSKRGVETMFRASYRVQMDLTALADAKANIMITINGLILSILLASIASKIDSNPYLLFPTSVTLSTSVLSIIFAVLAAVPRVESSPITLDEVRERNTNLLFFGNFSKLSREDYHTGMVEMMLDPDRVYHNMISDIYGIGSVLTKKFKLLRAAYLIFMIGIIISVVLFIITFFLNAGDAVALQPPPSTGGSLPGLP